MVFSPASQRADMRLHPGLVHVSTYALSRQHHAETGQVHDIARTEPATTMSART